MNIICGIFGHKEGKTYSIFYSDGTHMARCKRCGKMILFVNEKHPDSMTDMNTVW